MSGATQVTREKEYVQNVRCQQHVEKNNVIFLLHTFAFLHQSFITTSKDSRKNPPMSGLPPLKIVFFFWPSLTCVTVLLFECFLESYELPNSSS